MPRVNLKVVLRLRGPVSLMLHPREILLRSRPEIGIRAIGVPYRKTAVTRDLVAQPGESLDLVIEQLLEDIDWQGAPRGVEHLRPGCQVSVEIRVFATAQLKLNEISHSDRVRCRAIQLVVVANDTEQLATERRPTSVTHACSDALRDSTPDFAFADGVELFAERIVK